MINYFQLFNEITDSLKNQSESKKLLLHACCAPCSTTALERLDGVFLTSVFYYNPNITDEKEYYFRLNEEKQFLNKVYPRVNLIEGRYDTCDFYSVAKGKENLPERGARCYDCYALRLKETAKVAKRLGYDYFATTLTLSPYKNSEWLNEIGFLLEKEYGVKYLPTDFKKQNGYKRSIELSAEYNLYRQNFCGCEFSKKI